MKKIICAVICMTFTASCSSTTLIRSTDPQVKIYVDGEYRGVGQTTQTDSKTSFATTPVRFEKAGCAEQRHELPRGQEFQVGPFIGGLFLLVPFLWVSGYKSENTYEFSCVGTPNATPAAKKKSKN